MIRLLLFLSLFLFPFLSFGQSAEKEAYAIGVRGIELVDVGSYAEGIKLLKKARNLAPQEYDYTLEIGKAYLKSGDPKKAENYLFDLQYHVDVQPDLYLLLAKCYAALNEIRKVPDTDRKRELKTLQYGIERLPRAGILYLRLGRLYLELEQPINALAVWETGIRNAPNFSMNYYWAAHFLNLSDSALWAWIYGEVFLNLSEDPQLKRAIAPDVFNNAQKVLIGNWKTDAQESDMELKQIQTQFCPSMENTGNSLQDQVAARSCLIRNWKEVPSNIAPFILWMKDLDRRGSLKAYTASLFWEVEHEAFLGWLADNAMIYDRFTKWNHWNRLHLTRPIHRSK